MAPEQPGHAAASTAASAPAAIGIDAVRRRVRELLPAALFSLQAEKQDIDLVLKNGFFLYVYKDDWLYSAINERDKGFDAASYKRRSEHLRQSGRTGGPVTSAEAVLADVAANGHRPHYFDIGTNYGQWVIRASLVLGPAFSRLQVACFEPGLASRLAVVNLALNGLHDVDFLPGAVSDVDGIIPFFAAPGHTEDNKLVNRRDRHVCFPAWSTSMQSLLAGVDADAEIFLKIDTQGAEWEIFRGAGDSWRRPIAAVMEFFPNGLATRVKPRTFLSTISHVAVMAELDGHQRFRRFITEADFDGLLAEISAKKLPFCDLFLISKTHPRLRELSKRLSDA
jgi:FkbM family methyltransferase